MSSYDMNGGAALSSVRPAPPIEHDPRNELERFHREALVLAEIIEGWMHGLHQRLTGEPVPERATEATKATGHLHDAQLIGDRLRRACQMMDVIGQLG